MLVGMTEHTPHAVFRQVLIKSVSWWMLSTLTWTLPCHSSPWRWWRSSTKKAPGSGTHISATL